MVRVQGQTHCCLPSLPLDGIIYLRGLREQTMCSAHTWRPEPPLQGWKMYGDQRDEVDGGAGRRGGGGAYGQVAGAKAEATRKTDKRLTCSWTDGKSS